ncbi:MAG: hypothetical protein LPH21_03590 [Shewanella sp.]|nr:hypothetical protein [Shewanella sp.]
MSTRENARNFQIKKGIGISEKLMPKEDGDPWDRSSFLLEKLMAARDKKQPFSMVRLGDGEGRILGYPFFYNDQEICSQVLTYQYGPNVIELLKNKYLEDHIFHGVMTLKYGISQAIINADMLGVPSWLHFRYMNDQNMNAMLAQSLCLTETVNYGIDEKYVFDHFIFRRFQKDHMFDHLLNNLDFLGLITHTNVEGVMRERCSVRNIKNYIIPGHQTFMTNDEPQYPNFYKKLISELVVPYQGALFLVAAGYIGKIYCDEIKKLGGIAIDIGAIFDAWIGVGRDDATKNEHLRL